MRVIIPSPIDLVSTNIADDATALWSASTTYSEGDLVKEIDGLELVSSLEMLSSLILQPTNITRVYKSLRSNNTNKRPSEWLTPKVESATSATSTVVSTGQKTFTIQTGLGFVPGMVVKIAKTVTPITVNMTAEIISYTSGTGALVVSVYSISGEGTHAGWTIKSEDEVGFWEEVGATNQYKMFDGYIETQTVSTGNIEVKLNTKRIDYIVMFGLQASTVSFTLYDELETTVLWNTTVDLVYGSPLVAQVSDWYEYFFGIFDIKTDFSLPIPITVYTGVLHITITPTGDYAKCGGVVIGRALEVGDTLWGASASMTDYSEITTDDNGITKIKKGYWAKKNNLSIRVDKSKVDAVYKTITSLRGVPTAWLGNNDSTSFESLVVYGICRDFSVEFEALNTVGCSLEIEGLI